MMCVALLIIKASNSVIFWLLVLVAYRSTVLHLRCTCVCYMRDDQMSACQEEMV